MSYTICTQDIDKLFPPKPCLQRKWNRYNSATDQGLPATFDTLLKAKRYAQDTFYLNSNDWDVDPSLESSWKHTSQPNYFIIYKPVSTWMS